MAGGAIEKRMSSLDFACATLGMTSLVAPAAILSKRSLSHPRRKIWRGFFVHVANFEIFFVFSLHWWKIPDMIFFNGTCAK